MSKFHRKLCAVTLSVIVIIFLIQWQKSDSNLTTGKSLNIAIVVVLTTHEAMYKRALDSLKCYSKIHSYTFILAHDKDYKSVCKQNDKFFRRHCIVAQFLHFYDYLLFVDADVGVVNPKRRIEEFIDDRFDVTLYDRFFNAEIAAGSYIIKNTPIGMEFLMDFANYEKNLPNSFHATDNGAIHAYFLSKIFPDRYEDYKICLEVYNIAKNYSDVFAYENCVRAMMGIGEHFGSYRILRKGTAWVRDCWLTNSLWNPETDFMMHGWKTKQNKPTYNESDFQTTLKPKNTFWIDPIVGDFNFEQCTPSNYSWYYDGNLIVPAATIRDKLAARKRLIQRANFKHLFRMEDIIKL